MPELNLIDETFDKNQSHNYRLSFQFDYDTVSLCILDTIRNKYIVFRQSKLTETNESEILSALKTFLENDDLLCLNYKSVACLVWNSGNTFIPAQFFDTGKKEDVYGLNLAIPLNSNIIVNKISSLETYNIFAYPSDIQSIFSNAKPEIKLYHHSTSFVNYMISESENWIRTRCYVRVNTHSLDIGLAQNKYLEFFNSFEYKEYSDITFFILSVFEKFNLSPMNTDVYLSSGNNDQNEIVDFLKKYINVIRFLRPSNHFMYSYIFDESLLTSYVNLFNLVMCE